MAGTINIPLLSVFNDKGVKDALTGLSSIGTALKTLGKTALGAYSGMQLLQASIGFMASSANAARDLQRNLAGVETIFGSNTAKMQEFIKTSESMGMSQAQAAKAVAFLGSVFKQTGLPMDKVMLQTKTMVSIGADLASTYGYSVQEALTAMTATFRGEYDPIEKFGVAMKQQQVNAELAAMGLGKLKGQALIAAQQQVRYNMILQRTSDAQGAFARQSNNLFEQQQILQAVFTDMQATLGGLLVPALTKLLGAISPLVSTLAPHLAAGFNAVADAIVNSIPKMDDIANSMTSIFEGLATAISILAPLATAILPMLAQNIVPILGFFAFFKATKWVSGIWEAILAFRALAIAQAATAASAAAAAAAADVEAVSVAGAGAAAAVAGTETAGAVAAVGAAGLATPWGAIAAGIGLVAAAFIAISNNNAFSTGNSAAALKAGDAAVQAYRNKMIKDGMSDQINLATESMIREKAMKDFNAKLKKETVSSSSDIAAQIKAQMDKLNKELGNINTADPAALRKAEAARKKAIADATKLQAEVVKLSSKMAQDITDVLQKVADDSVKAFEKISDAATSFNDSFVGVVDSFKGLAKTAPVMGAFEQQTSDALQSLRDQAKEAFGKGLFGTGITADKALSELNKLVDGQATLLTSYAQQRDILAKKIDIARQISGSVLSFGNITSALQSVKNTVIQTSTQIIDGVSVTISKSVDEIQSADLVGEYQKILDKTKDFAKNLKSLKAAGLDSGLFKQIVDAGVEGGGATAAAIVAGGGATITELNSLFADLQTTGSDIAATTTDIMYANGGDIVNGFISGLMSQEALLAQAASTMASTFANTFTSTITAAINTAVLAAANAMNNATAAVNSVRPPSADYSTYIAGAVEGLSGTALQKQLKMLSGENVSTPGSFMNTLGYMSASAPATTTTTPVVLQVDGKTLATSLLTYERTNGAIYVRAN